ncbi:MAG: hypothetical protein ACHP84_00045 [Caulobacterales bacterium]
MSGKTTVLAIIAGCALWLLAALSPSAAFAGGMGGNCGCKPPPPHHCCKPEHQNINVEVKASVAVTATTAASTGAVVSGGGGGGGFYSPPAYTGLIQGLNVEGGTRRTAYEASRTRYEKVVIQAFCFDDRDVPHPASQVAPDRDIDEAYDGELYRCIAGTHMQVTIAKWSEHISFEGGQTLACQKGDALYHVGGRRSEDGQGGGRLECRPQKPARDCNERSLLRRFGAGIKVLTVAVTERYMAYREETNSATSTTSMSLDGGVGGVAF